jgi:hypothetical protein
MAVITRMAVLILTVAGLGLVQSGTALAAAAANDDFANATVISSLPFSDVVDNSAATSEPGEPPGGCGPAAFQTVWYSITPVSNITVHIDMTGSSFIDRVFNVYQQQDTGFGGLSTIVCATGPTILHLRANTTYYIQAGDEGFSTGGELHLNVQLIPAPPNDNFDNATVISPTALPFTDTEDATGATAETGEPVPTCSTRGSVSNSWWYSFTPASSGSFTASSTGPGAIVAAYTGSGLGNLTQIACARDFPLETFQAAAGTTYYLQVSDIAGGLFGPIRFTFDHAPQPVASFFVSPNDPSIFDTALFINESGDPAGVGFVRDEYNFGDGTTVAGCCPNQFGQVDATHQYAKDGDYTVTDTVSTSDGRTASAQQVIHVRTHDVAVTKFVVPTSASASQTRSITVGVSDKRYPETVQVQLFASDSQGGGFDLVGTLTQSVLVQTGKSTTPFAFSYTFTPGDATAGKVTFEAVASIQGLRDALPADNTAFALTTVH